MSKISSTVTAAADRWEQCRQAEMVLTPVDSVDLDNRAPLVYFGTTVTQARAGRPDWSIVAHFGSVAVSFNSRFVQTIIDHDHENMYFVAIDAVLTGIGINSFGPVDTSGLDRIQRDKFYDMAIFMRLNKAPYPAMSKHAFPGSKPGELRLAPHFEAINVRKAGVEWNAHNAPFTTKILHELEAGGKWPIWDNTPDYD